MSTSNNRYGNEVRPLWISEEAESKPLKRFSGEKLKRLVTNDLSNCNAISLANRGIEHIDDLQYLGKNLRRFDLSNNQLSRLHGFDTFTITDAANTSTDQHHGDDNVQNKKKRSHHHMLENTSKDSSHGLSLLNISSNAFKGDSGLEDLRYLSELRTLNISKNPLLHTIRSHVIKPLSKLQALIANDCGLVSAAFVRFLPMLNTLILSDNMLETLPMHEYGKFLTLKKLSIARNKLSIFPDLSSCPALNELRVNQNLIKSIPQGFINQHSKHMKILDISNNKIAEWHCVDQLAGMNALTNLSLHGNPICLNPPDVHMNKTLKEDINAGQIVDPVEQAYRHHVLVTFQREVGQLSKLFVQLIVLDNKRVKTKWTQGGAHQHHVKEDGNDMQHQLEVGHQEEAAGADIIPDAQPILDMGTREHNSKKQKKQKKKRDVAFVNEDYDDVDQPTSSHAVDASYVDEEVDELPTIVSKPPPQFNIDDSNLKAVMMGKKQLLESYGANGWD